MNLCVLQVQRWHQGNEHFGRAWQAGDVVGCMVDLNEHTMMFTLNGEVLLDDSGSELAFKDFEVEDGWCYVVSAEYWLQYSTSHCPLEDVHVKPNAYCLNYAINV